MVNYKVKRLITDVDGVVLSKVYENEKIVIKAPEQCNSEEHQKYLKMVCDRNKLSDLISETLGSFYFNILNGGLDKMDIRESVKFRFLYLCTHSNYIEKGSYICYENGRKMNKGAILDILNLSEREGHRTIKEMVESSLLTQDGNFYAINSDVVVRGKLSRTNKESESVRMFDDGIRGLYLSCDNPKQHKQLYYLFKMLPYINKKYNVICQNPEENVAKDVIPLTLTEICEVAGYNSSNVSRFKREMYQLKLNNQYAMLGVECANGMWYKINPRVLYGGYTNDHLEGFKDLIYTDFEIKSN